MRVQRVEIGRDADKVVHLDLVEFPFIWVYSVAGQEVRIIPTRVVPTCSAKVGDGRVRTLYNVYQSGRTTFESRAAAAGRATGQ